MLDQYTDKLHFPSYPDFELNRLLPTIKITMYLAIVFIFLFSFVDIKAHPEITKTIIIIRTLACIPLLIILSFFYSKNYKHLIPKLILPLGVMTLCAYIYLHTQVNGKIYYIALAWIYFLLVMIIIAPFYSKSQVVTVVSLGTLLSFIILYNFSNDQNIDYINNIFIRSLGSLIFSLILAFKVIDNERENYLFAKQIHQQTLYDYLTKVYNRRGFSVWIARFIKTHKNTHHCSIIMLDIDDFKKINDQYGHQIGDVVIKETASILTKQAKDNSCIVRFGGEEFLIVTPSLNPEDNKVLAENIRKLIEQHAFNDQNNETFHITTSIGLASSYETLHSMDKMLSIADNNLYKAKNNGKNQVVWE